MSTTRKRTPGRSVEATEDGWLLLQRHGMTVAEIAREAGVTTRRVRLGLADARLREPTQQGTSDPSRRHPGFSLVPMFGPSCKPLTLLTCEDVHPHGPIPEGSRLCCMAPDCHKSGMDHRKALQRDPRTDPKPEKRAVPKPRPEPTRAQKSGGATSGKMAKRRAAKRLQTAGAA